MTRVLERAIITGREAWRTSIFGVLSIACAACAPVEGQRGLDRLPPPSSATVCTSPMIAIEAGFSTAALASCRFLDDARLEVVIAPEDAPPINCSPWYAFRARSLDGNVHPLRIDFRYTACEHRYTPKASSDWQGWRALTPIDGQEAAFELQVGNEPSYIAAQEILPAETYARWLESYRGRDFARLTTIGQSVEGRDIQALEFGNPSAPLLVLVLGRQHPPEISGAKALMAFVQTLAQDTSDAIAYRERVQTVIVPLVNPDGVQNGHWRHNAGGVDLNRDWGVYSQPETRAVRDLLDARLQQGADIVMLLDFHSTGRDVLYTLPEDADLRPAGLMEAWIAAVEQHAAPFSFALSPGYSAGSGVSKNHLHERFGIPAITVELGDNTDRDEVARAGRATALALIDVLSTD